MLEILTAAETTDLVALAVVKAELGIAESDESQDASLSRRIVWASAAINRYCRRTLARQKYRETLGGSGGQGLMLSRLPIESASLLSVSGSEITDWRIDDANAGILWRLNGWPEALAYSGTYGGRRYDSRSADRATIVVEYWAGFFLPGMELEEGDEAVPIPLPADIERAAVLAVREWARNDARDGRLTSTSTTSEELQTTVSASFVAGASLSSIGPLPAEARALLRPYRL